MSIINNINCNKLKIMFFTFFISIIVSICMPPIYAYGASITLQYKTETNKYFYTVYDSYRRHNHRESLLILDNELDTESILKTTRDVFSTINNYFLNGTITGRVLLDCDGSASSLDVRVSNMGDTIIAHCGYHYGDSYNGNIYAYDANGNLLEKLPTKYKEHYERHNGKTSAIYSYDYWSTYDEPAKVITKTVYIKPDYSSIKSAVDSLVTNQINTMNSSVLAVKDYALGFSYSDYELKNFIEDATYSDLTVNFSSYYNGINFNYMPSPSSTYSASINSDNDMVNYISSVSNNCSSQINYSETYGKAFIKSFNNKYNYMKSMRAMNLKRLLAYCVNSNPNLLGKCIFIYKDLVGVNSKIYLPNTYVKSAFREYKNYDSNTWYSLNNGQLEVLECVQFKIPSNLGNITIK